jgi:hypothetical protein
MNRIKKAAEEFRSKIVTTWALMYVQLNLLKDGNLQILISNSLFLKVLITFSEFTLSSFVNIYFVLLSIQNHTTRDYSHFFSFSVSFRSKHDRSVTEYNLKGKEWGLVIEKGYQDKYKMDGNKFSADVVNQFYQDFVDGKLEKWVKSQDVPEKNDGPVSDYRDLNEFLKSVVWN